MKQLFPAKQVMGFVFSLILTAIALAVYFLDVSFTAGLTILIVTAFVQALLQLIVFMHAGETKDKWSIYGNVYFMIFIALITIFGTLFLFSWDM
ncbi:cytochrome aa3 quinol oxidase subunit IV [Cytobacillus praedii]|jgi:cytochrome aa3-600 menaquinol oxidase subunit 4|uniref:Quinol oxidase subunit 4 n=1 Tax=Cytobacillus praedii TaxID=1742358 RepID=A0A4R1AMJ6_9BACI|nr:cytochrome aa3 quinol oxidase subunit IV [Cytobacillus praedii]MED3550729.1 cytochrome aa3 quinol oxidase subunit IV [Cytobacillus praedii]MED3575603.1 cytochrome aa3 quinol oxidase subunit IV [Cytobacillus praedii]TCJ00933.1 cytochrome aa3 quinol oxidase subunit IV [Cytobacillus praedii]